MPTPGLITRERYPDLLEAWEYFCGNNRHRIAWNNLISMLKSLYLSSHLRFKDGKLKPSELSIRTQYLASLSITQFGYLTRDILETLFRQSEEPELDQVNPERTLARKWLSILSEEDFVTILVDFVYEFDTRLSLSYISTDTWSDVWHTTYADITYSIEHILPSSSWRGVSRNALARRGDLRTGVTLLRRALSARFIRKQTPNWAKTAISTNVSSTRPANPTKSQPWEETKAVDDAASDEEEAAQPSGLEPIFEDTEEHAWYEDSEIAWNAHSSVGTTASNSWESLIDFYSHGFERESSISSVPGGSQRSSVEVAQLKRSGQDNLHYSQRQSLGPQSSLSATDKISAHSRLTSHYSFRTAHSQVSMSVVSNTAPSKRDSIDTFLSFDNETLGSTIHGSYRILIQEKDLAPEPMVENNWSGRGQHAEYRPEERDNIPLEFEKVLGQTKTARVDSVRCRRVRLVRKTIECTKRTGFQREDALREVQHLYRVQHSHIVRLVGTYVVGSDLAILTYPCAEWNLQQFMQSISKAPDIKERSSSLRKFFTCLAKVLDFMHSFPLKHMDVKPQNLLVRDIRHSAVNESDPYKIYFTDFGISRSYPSVEESETESWTSFTRTYAAKEVVLQESRGLSADIFSLGCVYAEMLAVHLDATQQLKCDDQEKTSIHWTSLKAARVLGDTGSRPYYSTIEDVRLWLMDLPVQESELHAVREWTMKMIDEDPSKRPCAREIADDPHLPFACLGCTLRSGPEAFEVADVVPHEQEGVGEPS